MRRLLYVHVFLCCLCMANPFCPSQCTCVLHGRADGTGSRSVVCNDPDMSDIPVNVPVDTVKLRIEKTNVRRIPTEAFYYLAELRYLWITYNSVTSVDTASFYNLKVLHELRLDGNMISMFPWESLKEMPSLRTLDLHNNRITNVPTEAIPYLLNITYLDLSSNKLTTLPSDLMDIWPPFNGVPVSYASQKTVLGLQDNPWFCDCKISKMIEISKMTDTPVVLMDLFLTCSGPENLSGVLFQRAELDNCVKPSVMTSATKITSTVGSNVLLRCDATGLPTPNLYWAKSDGSPVNNTVQESPGDGIRWSIMSLHGILYKDAGNYSCKAKNFAGNAEATISVTIAGGFSTTISPLSPNVETGPTSQGTFAPSTFISNSPTITFTDFPKTTSTTTTTTTTTRTLSTVPKKAKTTPSPIIQKASPKQGKIQNGGNGRKLAADEKSTKSDIDTSESVKDLKIVEETTDTAVLLWTADGLPNDAPLTVVYSPYDEDDIKGTVETNAGSGKVLLEGLSPGIRYTVCLVAKGSAAGKDPCIEFYTLDNVEDDGQNQLFIIISGIACVLVLPLIALLLYKILALYCKGRNTGVDEEELEKESYVKFETISMKQRTLNSHPTELWTRRQTQESERMLLCSRSSIDSQMTYKSESSRSEYLC